jgi:hypothetical protein
MSARLTPRRVNGSLRLYGDRRSATTVPMSFSPGHRKDNADAGVAYCTKANRIARTHASGARAGLAQITRCEKRLQLHDAPIAKNRWIAMISRTEAVQTQCLKNKLRWREPLHVLQAAKGALACTSSRQRCPAPWLLLGKSRTEQRKSSQHRLSHGPAVGPSGLLQGGHCRTHGVRVSVWQQSQRSSRRGRAGARRAPPRDRLRPTST